MVKLTKIATTHTPAPYGDLASWAVGRPTERAGAGELGQVAEQARNLKVEGQGETSQGW